MVVFCTSDRKSIGFDTHRTLRDGDSWVNTATYSKVLSAVRQAHCELSAVRQDFGVTLRQAQAETRQLSLSKLSRTLTVN
jgi:hypothetical protein